MQIKIEAENYRCLRHVRWSPTGVCALVGPNGSGKSTLLRVAEFARHVYKGGVSRAIKFTGGAWGLRHLLAEPEAEFRFAFGVGNLEWTYSTAGAGANFDANSDEKVRRGTELVLHRRPNSGTVEYLQETLSLGDRAGLRAAVDSSEKAATELAPLIDVVRNHRVFRDYVLSQLREQGSPAGDEREMNQWGNNVFSVLRNWRDKKKDHFRYEFVLNALRQTFPGIAQDLEFDVVAQTVSARVLTELLPESVPIQMAPDGLLVGLLHLTALAGTSTGTLVCFDDFENSLHPFAIRKLIEHFRDWSEEHDVTICMATHSPVVIDEFNDDPERLFVMEPGREVQPARVMELADPEWLRQFTLGRLYTHGDIGSQHSVAVAS